MKRITSLILAAALSVSCSITAAAVGYPGGEQDTTISTSIAPTFTVTIPSDTAVTFNEVSTDFGAVTLESAKLNPLKAVQVTLNASGTMKNAADATKTLPYTVKKADGTAFVSAKYTAAGETTALKIEIAQAAWDSASAGEYSDTVSFNIAYVDA